MRYTLPPLLVACSSPAAAQGFYDACCRSWSLGYHTNDHFLVAKCPGPGGANVTSAVDLQDCLTNAEGALKAGRLGYAFYTCNACSASTADATMTCQCRTSGNRYLTTSLDLNTVITNNNGIAGCFDLAGIEVAPKEP